MATRTLHRCCQYFPQPTLVASHPLHHHSHSSVIPLLMSRCADSLPVYNLTHTIRILVVPRCETTLSWDQLRSPQVSQFLIKPIQQQIRASHFSRATLYALLANCLQFNKEVQMNPGNSGASKTRALVCELLAIKLLKEFSTRELVGRGEIYHHQYNTLTEPRLVCPRRALDIGWSSY